MSKSPYWETKTASASQEIPWILWYPEVLYCIPSTSWRSILTLSSHLCLGFQCGLFPSGFPTKALYAPLFFPIYDTRPTPLILHYLMTWIYLVMSTDHKASHYVVFSTPLLLHPSYAQICSSAPYSQKPEPMFLPQCETASFTPIQNNRQN